MKISFLRCGAISGFLAVALGAFGAHGLRPLLEPSLYTTFQTGVEYHAIHALALVLIGILQQSRPSPWLNRSGWLMLGGTLLFSGSLYLLALTGVRDLGLVTPFGGAAFLLGWLALAVAGGSTGRD